jgi:hypothetical protein
MRLMSRPRHANPADQEEIARGGARPPDADEIVETARKLQALVETVTAEEFSWQEAHYDRDSRQGRELLFLMANHEWVRATSEVVDITRSDAIETTIKIDIDLGQITHEAFRKRTGPIWLPVAVLPPSPDHSHLQPDLFAAVTDATGSPVPMLPAADLRHQASAAMAEIIGKMAFSHLPSSTSERFKARSGEPAAASPPRGVAGAVKEPPVDTRDLRLVLSAAIYRLLRDGSGDGGGTGSGRGVQLPRLIQAKGALLELLDIYIGQLEMRFGPAVAVPESGREHQFTPELARRAVKILQALAGSIVIVVLADFVIAPSVLTVRVPTRELNVSKSAWIKPWTWVIRPAGLLEIDVLLPTADADRQIQVNLPDGVLVDRPDDKGGKDDDIRPWLDIAVHTPLPLQDFAASMKQVFKARGKARESPGLVPPSLVQSLLDLAWAKGALALDILHLYKAVYRSDGKRRRASDRETVDDPVGQLDSLFGDLDRLGQQGPPAPGELDELSKTWRRIAFDKLSLSRHIMLDLVNPQTAVGRANMIEDVSQRATPRQARAYVNVTVDDRDYFSTARSSAFMSLILMCGVLCFLLFWRVVNPKASAPVPEVLAIVLTLFATIQADRIERPDRSTLRGQLFAMGSWLIGASVLPSLALALALAFQTRGVPADLWASGCVLAQFLLLVLMKRGPLTPTGRPRLLKRRILSTHQPDYRYFEALRSDYWRSTTAEALMIGRMAYGYVIWQKADPTKQAESISPKLRPLLQWDEKQPPTESSSVLALLRTGTLRQAVTFVVFRGKPDKWPEENNRDNDRHDIDHHTKTYERGDLDLDPRRLAPADIVTSTVDVFVGVDRHEILTIAAHPTALILEAAANKLVVLDIQLPVPAPALMYEDRQWARVRVALRDADDIHRLTDFLIAVCGTMAEADNGRHIVAVQTVPAGRLRLLSGPAALDPAQAPEIGTEVPVLTTDLDIVNGYAIEDEPPAARTWRVLAICGDARSNIESDIVQHLAGIRKHFQLAGLTYALLHGTAVMVLLVHEPAVDRSGVLAGQVVRSDRDYAAALQETLRQKPACEKLSVPVCKHLSRDDLEPAVDHAFPMLRVRVRWQDRPGVILNVLESISKALDEALPAIAGHDWSISYARVQVLTGQVAVGRLTIRMHIPPDRVDGWDLARMAEMGRKIESMAATEAARRAALGSAGDDQEKPEEPVIGIDRIKLTARRPVDQKRVFPGSMPRIVS